MNFSNQIQVMMIRLIWVSSIFVLLFNILQYSQLIFQFYSFFRAENPPLNKDLRKRKREEEDEEMKRKIFQPNIEKETECDDESNHSSASSNKNSESGDESPADKFRRGCDLPSDLDMGDGDNSADSSNNEDFEDDGDWNMMGAALEREFLGLD